MDYQEIKQYRVGNLFYAKYYSDKPVEVDGIFYDEMEMEYGLRDIEGAYLDIVENIPITEEWLVKFGFEKVGDTSYLTVTKNHDYQFFIAKTGNGYNVTDANLLKALQYVHQLQNLYFALTGEELELSN